MQVWSDLLFLARSLTFWLWILAGLLAGYLMSLLVARIRFTATKSPYRAAEQGIAWGFGIAAVALSLGLFYLWLDSYALFIAPPIVFLLAWFLLIRVGKSGSVGSL